MSLSLSLRRPLCALLLLLTSLLGAPRGALGKPIQRVTSDVRGNFVIIGNTVGFDCRAGIPKPLVGTVDTALCGTNVNDTAVDVLWQSDAPLPGQAAATIAVTPETARSTAVLQLPAGAKVSYARLYWAAGLPPNMKGGATAVIERQSPAFTQRVSADASVAVPSTSNGPGTIYQSSADVTRLVQRLGAGPYRVGGIPSVSVLNKDLAVTFVVWSLVVFYQSDQEPPRNLTIFDGLEQVTDTAPANALLEGFVVPDDGHEARLGVLAYEGDDTTGDSLTFNDQILQDELNPAQNFFNGTRSSLGKALTVAGDLPQLSGAPGSMNGFDSDVVDVASLLKPGDTSARISAVTKPGQNGALDVYFLGAFVSAISTLKPVFNETKLTVVDVTAPDRFQPGDTVEFTIEVKNTGRDAGVATVVHSVLPPGLTYVPGSLQVGSAARTDAAGDDVAEYIGASRTVRARVGTGADAGRGGRVGTSDAPIVIKYRARIDDATRGEVSSQATVTAAGEKGIALGIPPARFYSWDGSYLGRPTVFVVPQCSAEAQCAGNAAGTSCVEMRFCGCTADAQCGAGRICDTVNRQCAPPRSDLQLTVTPTPNPPLFAVPVLYTLTLSNLGPEASPPGVKVFFDVPFGGEIRSVDVGSAWSCTTEKAASQVVCERADPLQPNTTAPDIKISVFIGGDTPDAAILTGAVDIAESYDPSRSNNVYITLIRPVAINRPAGGGFGCSATGGAAPQQLALLGLTALAGLWALLRRRPAPARARRRLWLALLLCLLPTSALAQRTGFQLNRYEPTLPGEYSFLVDHPWFSSTRYFAAGVTLNYAHDALVYGRYNLTTGSFTETQSIVGHQLLGHVDLAGSFLDRLTVSASLPIVLLERGDSAGGLAPISGVAVGDPRIGVLGRIYGQPYRSPFSMSAGVQVWIPLRAISDSLPVTSSDSMVRILPKAIIGGLLANHFLWSFTFGYLYRDAAVIGDFKAGNRVGSEIQFGASFSYADMQRRFAVGPEALLSTVIDDGSAFKQDFTSLDLLLGANYNVARQVQLGLAVGMGLLREPGTPDFRMLFRVAYAPVRIPKGPGDKDGDGVADPDDACPDEYGLASMDVTRNGCPQKDQDKDGVLDEDDQCPRIPVGKVADPERAGCPLGDRDGDGVNDSEDECPDTHKGKTPDVARPGCPLDDKDADGVLDTIDQCPLTPKGPRPDPLKPGCPEDDQDKDGIGDSEDTCPDVPAGPTPDTERKGCPAQDKDGDTVVDRLDACPDEVGAPHPDPRKNGCPGLVTMKGGMLVIMKPVFFATGKDVILPQSFPVLQAVADALKAQPQIKKIRIEGHTDNKGNAAKNLDLSDRRAKSVGRYLVGQGIEVQRLSARGFGSQRPIQPNTTEPGRAANRRVEFYVVDPPPPPGAPEPKLEKVEAPAQPAAPAAPQKGKKGKGKKPKR